MAKFRIQPHVRLQEWVADENGFFEDEGLDYVFETAGFAGGSALTAPDVQPADAAPMAVRSGALEDIGQYYLLEQAGFRQLVDTTFMIGFLAGGDVAAEDLERYFRALRRAQSELDIEPDRYKPLWLREVPEDLLDGADVRRFGTGERIVFEPYTREMFDRTHRWMEQWDLFDAGAAQRRSYEDAVLV